MIQQAYWILDPPGHRRLWAKEHEGRDGTTMQTIFGEANVIVPPPPPPDVWVCDACNVDIDEWPVHCIGSYAYCENCWRTYHADVEIEAMCACEACWKVVRMAGQVKGRIIVSPEEAASVIGRWLSLKRRIDAVRTG